MNIFNKFEAIGIFLSIAIMAVSLSVIRFNTDTFMQKEDNEATAIGSVVSVNEDAKDESGIEDALKSAARSDGTIVDLVIDDVKKGTGKEVTEGTSVTVHYIGTLQDGTKFDSSYDRGQPFVFTVGEGRVISGWEKGLIGMKVGGQRILVIPSEMAYGNRSVGTIPPNSTLVFSIELLEIK